MMGAHAAGLDSDDELQGLEILPVRLPDLLSVLTDNLAAVHFCQAHGLMAKEKECLCQPGAMCEIRMEGNNAVWRCKRGKCRKQQSMKRGTFFGFHSKLQLKVSVLF
jgi:hypothetical protein